MVLAPFIALEPDEFIGDRPQAFANDVIVLEVIEGLGEALRKRKNAAARHGLEIGGVEISEVGLSGLELAVDAVEAGRDVGCNAEVGVERRWRSSDPRRALPREPAASVSGCCRRKK